MVMNKVTVSLAFLVAAGFGSVVGQGCQRPEGANSWADVKNCMECAANECMDGIVGLRESCPSESDDVTNALGVFGECMGDENAACVSLEWSGGRPAPRPKRSPRGGNRLTGCFMRNGFECMKNCATSVSWTEHPLKSCVKEPFSDGGAAREAMEVANNALKTCIEDNNIDVGGKGRSTESDDDDSDDESDDDDSDDESDE